MFKKDKIDDFEMVKENFNDTIVKFIKRKQQRVGVLVGYKKNDRVYIGWSLCHKNDIYNEKKAIQDATNRAKTNKQLLALAKNNSSRNISYKFKALYPSSLNKDLIRFIERCKKYFRVNSIENYRDVVNAPLIANRDNIDFGGNKKRIITIDYNFGGALNDVGKITLNGIYDS